MLDLQSKAKASIEAYQKGTWTRPTAADPALFPGLGGCKAIVQQTRQQSASSPASSDGNNVLASLEGVQPTLDDYLRSFQAPGAANQAGVPMGITSSDAFLQGALTGNWEGLTTPLAPIPEYTGQYNLSPPSLDVPHQEHFAPYYSNLTPQNGTSIFAASPYSEGSLSSGSGGNASGAQSTANYPPTIQPLGPSPVLNDSDTGGQPVDAVLLWDNFLRDLGLQTVSN